jgi:hypothetical protein
MQETLDAALERAPERVKAQFALLLEHDNRYRIPDGNHDGLTRDDKDRLTDVIQRPSRLDAATTQTLAQVLASQRHAEDALGPRQPAGQPERRDPRPTPPPPGPPANLTPNPPH